MKTLHILLISAATLFAGGAAAYAQDVPDTLESSNSRGLFLKGEDLDDRTIGDLRNQLTAMIPGLEVTEAAGGFFDSGDFDTFTAASGQINLKYRGTSSMTFIVDGMLIPYASLSLDRSQVESIEYYGDIMARAKFGPLASNGALVITTKRGSYNTPISIKVSAEGGVALTDKVPEWADGVDYALLNNQARANAGYQQKYSPSDIEGFLRGNAYDLKYPNVDYRSLMLSNWMPVSDVSVSITGGGEKTKYAATISEMFSGDIVNTNESQDYNRINISSNVTTQINRFLSINAGFNSLLSFRRAGQVSWNAWQNVPAVAYPVILGKNSSDDASDDLAGMTIYGTTADWPNNYYAKLAEGGFYTTRTRSAMIYANITLDFDQWVKGLRSDTYISYNTFVSSKTSKNNDYLAYYWDSSAEDGMGVISPDHQGVKASGKSISSLGAGEILQLKEHLTWKWNKNGHNVNLGASFMMYQASMQAFSHYYRNMQLVGDAKYNYKNRYVLEGVLQYAGSSRFTRSKRFKPFGTLGASWIISNEPFMENASWVDLLKIRAQYGTIGKYSSALGSEYLYESNYSFDGSGDLYGPTLTLPTWFGNKTWRSQTTTISRIANDDLTWETNTMWEAGIDFDFCKGFSASFTAYQNSSSGGIAEVATVVPTVYGISGASVYANHTGSTTTGWEAALSYRHNWGDFGLNAGVSLFAWDTKYDKIVNDDYLYDYQKKTGTSEYAIWGFECTGKYETQEQLETVPSYGSVQIGDLMYKDQNGDGEINTNDRVIIGNTQPKVRYSVNLGLTYRNWSLQAVGNGRSAADYSCTGDYFWNGWGDGNYSAFVRDNIGGAYPRLSYVKSTNNFVASSFWLRKYSWFKIQDVTLSYNIPLKSKVVKGLKVSLKAQNLATFSDFEYLDPEAPSAGVSSYPLFKTFTAGVKINF